MRLLFHSANFAKPANLAFVGCVALVLGLAYCNLSFILNEGFDQPSYHPKMTIDSASYFYRAIEMNTNGDWFTSLNRNSVAIQTWFALIFRFFENTPGVLKISNWVLWCATLMILYALTYRSTRNRWVAIAACLIMAQSESLQKFCAIAQHEIFATFLVTLATYWAVHGEKPIRNGLALGVIFALLAFTRKHWLVLFPLMFFYGRFHGPLKSNATLKAAAVSFLLISVPWNLHYSLKEKDFFLFQKGYGFRYALHAQATGENFPRTWSENGVYGLRYIYHEPMGYLALLGRRAGFLTGWHPDIWYVPSRLQRAIESVFDSDWIRREGARRIAVALSLVVTLMGIILAINASYRSRVRPHAAWVPLSIPVVLLLPQLLINSANRFLIPGIPIFAYYSAIGFWLLIRGKRVEVTPTEYLR